MKALEIWQQVTGHYYELRLEDDALDIEANDFSRELPPGLITELKAHKPEVVSLLRHQEQADALLLESTQRLSRAWPAGCPLDSPEWERLENELHRAYRTLDRRGLTAAIQKRESFAMQVFEAHRKEAANAPLHGQKKGKGP
ncbi:MAG: hypothetical protein M0Z32_01015 [Actinomycetota bacterium]|jgi:hypothetical protein|nr:hypothetical protein [Actinomycetota bacterium]MCL6093538.1 hypothetical protein [Actinomycetota bacterium]MDA8166325.1 hypothetical protein [Actinomycetota bacterium]